LQGLGHSRRLHEKSQTFQHPATKISHHGTMATILAGTSYRVDPTIFNLILIAVSRPLLFVFLFVWFPVLLKLMQA
jgi:multisubunit Na+/H+ antiporter MnhG subunit